MRIPQIHRDRRRLDVAMTPMIDVVFQLLIFFLCTASFQLPEELLPTSLQTPPSGNTAQSTIDVEPDLERILVQATHIDGQTRWVVNERPCGSLVEFEQVLRAVVAIDPSLPVILDVSGDVPLGDMIEVYDLARLVGFERIQFAASPK